MNQYYSYYLSTTEINHDNPEQKTKDLSLRVEHVPFMVQLMAFSEWICARNSLCPSPPSVLISIPKSDERKHDYCEAMIWLIELLEENKIDYTLNYFEIFKEVDGLKMYNGFKNRTGFYLEFQGQTWCPYFGFKAKETLIHIDNEIRNYSFNEKGNCHVFRPSQHVVMQERIIDVKELAFRLSYSADASKNEIKEKLQHIWNNQKAPRQHSSVQLVQMHYDNKSWAIPVALPSDLNVKAKILNTATLQEESLLGFAKTYEIVPVKAEQIQGFNNKQKQNWNSWSQDYLLAWKKLQKESNPDKGEEIKVVNLVSEKGEALAVTSLYLDLSKVRVAQKLLDFWAIKDARFFIATPNVLSKFNRQIQFDNWSEQSLTMIFKERTTLACLDYERLIEMCWQKESIYKGSTYSPNLYSWQDEVVSAEHRWTGGQIFKMKILDPLVDLYLKKEIKFNQKPPRHPVNNGRF